MEGFSFCEGALPPDTSWGFESSLFNSLDHIRLQAEKGWRSFYALTDSGAVEGVIHFHTGEGIARSPLRSPYGSFEVSAKISPEGLYAFLAFVEERLAAHKVTAILIKCPPALYFPRQSTMLHVFLVNRGYKVVHAEAGAMIPLSAPWLPDSSEQGRQRQARDAGLRAEPAALAELPAIYGFIAACRQERAQELSMSLEELQRVADVFPGHIHLHAVWQGDQMTAASVAIVVNSRIVYNFLLGHSRAFHQLSPVVLLLAHMHNRYRNEGFEWLDLGTSALPEGPNFPLLRFKVRLGAQLTPKFTFEKRLSGD